MTSCPKSYKYGAHPELARPGGNVNKILRSMLFHAMTTINGKTDIADKMLWSTKTCLLRIWLLIDCFSLRRLIDIKCKCLPKEA
jgi:hypothetical protein